MISYRKATREDLETIWNKSIADNPGDERYLRWKNQFIRDNETGAAATFVVVIDGDPVGEGTLLFSPDCRAIRGRTQLADGMRCTNVNALRIRPEYEGLGHISKLMQAMMQYAKELGYGQITIGVEPCEARNLGIYLHWGFDQFLFSETEDDCLVLYYGKKL